MNSDTLGDIIEAVQFHEIEDHIDRDFGKHGWGVAAKVLVKWLLYFMARSRLWKQSAKKGRRDANRRKELLRRYQDYAEFLLAFEKEYPAPKGWIGERKKLLELMSEVKEEL